MENKLCLEVFISKLENTSRDDYHLKINKSKTKDFDLQETWKHKTQIKLIRKLLNDAEEFQYLERKVITDGASKKNN